MTDTTRPNSITSADTTTAATATTPARRTFGAEPDDLPQYSRGRVLKIWAAAALPMAALAWVGAPLLAGAFDGPSAWPRAILVCLTAGMVWQFVFVMISVRSEQGSLRWSVLKDALWLHSPRNPRTGRRGGRLWWVLLPLILLVAAKEELPKIPAPVDRDQALSVPRLELADALGTSLCRVKRTLALFSLSGVVSADARTIRVLDWRRLSSAGGYDATRLGLPDEQDDSFAGVAAEPENTFVTAAGDPACFV